MQKRLWIAWLSIVVALIIQNAFFLWRWDKVMVGFVPFEFFFFVIVAIVTPFALAWLYRFVWPDPPAEVLTLITEEKEE